MKARRKYKCRGASTKEIGLGCIVRGSVRENWKEDRSLAFVVEFLVNVQRIAIYLKFGNTFIAAFVIFSLCLR